MSNAYVPVDLLRECLVRLSAECLVRFKRVSKPWSALISSKEFAREHLKLSLMEPKAAASKVIIKTFDMYEVEWRKTFKLLTANLDSPVDFIGTQQVVDHPLQEYGEIPIKLIGSCHGLICMKNCYDGLCLYNPCIKKYWKLPYFQSGYIRRLNQDTIAYGFGYDDVHNDYKVVRLIPCFKVFEIYSLKSDSWKRFNNFSINTPNRSHSGVFVNFHVHWLDLDRDYGRPNYFSITGIDLRTDGVYQVMELPYTVANHTAKNLGVLDGCLTLFTCSTMMASSIQVWVMKQYGVHESWTLLTNIQLRQVVRDTYLYGLRLRPNEEIVIQHSMLDIVWFDMRRNWATKLKIPGLDRSTREVYPIEYSLIDPKHIRSEGACTNTSQD